MWRKCKAVALCRDRVTGWPPRAEMITDTIVLVQSCQSENKLIISPRAGHLENRLSLESSCSGRGRREWVGNLMMPF